MPKCLYKYDSLNDSYEKVENGDFPLNEWYGFCLTSYKQKIYIFGGSSKGRICDDVYSFDTINNKWDKLASMIKARRRSSAVLII